MPPALSEAVVNFRLNHGMCPACATRIYEVVETEEHNDSQRLKKRMVPMSIEGVVREGRCLFCYPDHPQQKQVVPATQPTAASSAAPIIKLEEVRTFRATTSITDSAPAVPTPSPAFTTLRNASSSKDTASTCSSVSESTPAACATTKKRKQHGSRESVTNDSRKKDIFIPIPTIRLLPPSPTPKAKDHSEKPASKNLKKKDAAASVMTRVAHATKQTYLHVAESSDTGEEEDLDNALKKKSSKSPIEITIRDFHGCAFPGKLISGTVQKGTAELAYTYPEGDEYAGRTSYYKGEIANGMLEGQGHQNDAAGCIYEGSFRRGASNGYGTCRWPTGWVYEGEWVDDLRHGRGKCYQGGDENSGEVYNGEWKADMWHGEGELKFAGGDSYKGEFREDKMQGKGTYTFFDGSVYVGNFKKDFRDGHGKMTYADGQDYEGTWKNNWREGSGKLTYTDGSVFEGTFRADERQDGLLRMPDGIMRVLKGGELQP